MNLFSEEVEFPTAAPLNPSLDLSLKNGLQEAAYLACVHL